MNSEKKVLVALSGGVDSSVTTAILKEMGYHCQGAFIVTHDKAQQAMQDAQAVADKLDIKLHILDWQKDFKTQLLDAYFCKEYQKGRTPNPCVYCNRHMKFAGLLKFAESLELDYLATGHYAQIIKDENASFGLYRAAYLEKDQSYALAMLEKSMLSKILMPLGTKSKPQIRELAKQFRIGTADKPDSQEICFIPDNDYVSKLETLAPQLKKTGNVIDTDGNILGQHQGIHRYTIGQRRGLGIAMGIPWYVVALDSQKNQVILGTKENLMHTKCIAKNVNWLIDSPNQEFKAIVKIRYNHKGSTAIVKQKEDNQVEIIFDEPVSAITPGQTAVIYTDTPNGSRLIAGGWIENAFD